MITSRLKNALLVVWLMICMSTQSPAQRTSLYVDPNATRPTATDQPTVAQTNNAAAYPTQMQNISPDGQVIAGMPAYANAAQVGIGNSELANASWIYAPVAPPRVLRVHDLINIRVEETAQTAQLGNMQARKNATLDMLLSNWVRFEGIDSLKPGVQADGDPRVTGIENEVYRADSNLRTRESITFNIQSEISDIRPNGLLVLSATKRVNYNDNTWELSLSGLCRPQDVAADNTVLSKDIFDLKIDKNEMGHVREAYSRGWFSRWYGKFKPF